jgi:SSS family solute:Na+ symporter
MHDTGYTHRFASCREPLIVTIHPVDLAIIVLYLLAITGLGIWAGRRRSGGSREYFLAGRSLGWPMIGLALFATNISTVHLVGLASAGYSHGLVFGNFEWLAAFCLVLLGLVFAPFYFQAGVSTLPEYLERRFSPGARTMLAVMAVFAALFIHIGVSLYAGAAIIERFFGLDPMVSILVVAAMTALYTVIGGLTAVVVTEAIQTVLLLLGAVVVTVLGVLALNQQGIASFDALRAAAPEHHLSMLHAGGDYPWYAMLLGYPVLGIWYWCADQTIVQRVLGARSQADAQAGPIFAGFIKILPVFLMVLPGVIASVLFSRQIGDEPDLTLPVLIEQLVPVGLKGLLAAGLLAALMSTVAGALNSAATLVAVDIVKRVAPRTSDRALVAVGRITAVVAMVLAVAWSTQGENFGGIFAGLNQMIACLAPPITTVFLWGVFWPRGTGPAAVATLVGGFVLGGIVFVADFPAFGLQLITHDLDIPFMLQAWWLFVICSGIFVVVSLITPPPPPERVRDLCWSNPWAALRSKGDRLRTDPRAWSLVLLVVMGMLYWWFA